MHPSTEDQPDPQHRRPAGVSVATVAALGKLSAALDHVEDARGHLYAFHRLCGSAETTFEEAARMLSDAGHDDVAAALEREVLGRNPLPGMWSFQMVEAYDEGYYSVLRSRHTEALEQLVQGRQHLHEAETKERLRPRGREGHEATPEDA